MMIKMKTIAEKRYPNHDVGILLYHAIFFTVF